MDTQLVSRAHRHNDAQGSAWRALTAGPSCDGMRSMSQCPAHAQRAADLAEDALLIARLPLRVVLVSWSTQLNEIASEPPAVPEPDSATHRSSPGRPGRRAASARPCRPRPTSRPGSTRWCQRPAGGSGLERRRCADDSASERTPGSASGFWPCALSFSTLMIAWALRGKR